MKNASAPSQPVSHSHLTNNLPWVCLIHSCSQIWKDRLARRGRLQFSIYINSLPSKNAELSIWDMHLITCKPCASHGLRRTIWKFSLRNLSQLTYLEAIPWLRWFFPRPSFWHRGQNGAPVHRVTQSLSHSANMLVQSYDLMVPHGSQFPKVLVLNGGKLPFLIRSRPKTAPSWSQMPSLLPSCLGKLADETWAARGPHPANNT